MAWYCKCPRCRLREWDFTTQGAPSGPEWQEDENGWIWTPNVAARIGGYRLINIGSAGVILTMRFGNDTEARITVRSYPTSEGRIYYLTIGPTAHSYVLTATKPITASVHGILLTTCYWQPFQRYVIRAVLLDENQENLGEMETAIQGQDDPTPVSFTAPQILVPLGTTYVAIDGIQESFQGCCNLCRPTGCHRVEAVPRAVYEGVPALLYGPVESLRVTTTITASEPPWVIFRIGQCCEDEDGQIGDVMEVNAALGIETLQVRWYNCGSYHGGGGTKNASLAGDWETGTHDYTFTLCVRNYESKTVVSVSVFDDDGHAAYTSIELFTSLTYWSRWLCHPEFEGSGDPSDVFELGGVYPVEIITPYTVRYETGSADVCGCLPIPGPLGPWLCNRVLCPEGDLPQGWLAEVEGLPDQWRFYDGAYVLRENGICPEMTTTDWTGIGMNLPEPSSPNYPFAAQLASWMEHNFPGVTDFPVYCRLRAGTGNSGNDGSFLAFCLGLYIPSRATQYEPFEAIPFLLDLLIKVTYNNQSDHCISYTRAALIGIAPWPMCPVWPSVVMSLLAQMRATIGASGQCDRTTPEIANLQITVQAATL